MTAISPLPRKVAFIGLGVMGYRMAGHLARAGHEITVYNRHPKRATDWQAEFGGNTAATPADAVSTAEFIMLCVGRDEDVRSVICDAHGVGAGIAAGAVVIDHTTTSASLAREMAAWLQPRQAHFVDAPVSGGEQGAINGQLTLLCGGEAPVFERIQPIVACYTRAITYLGATGSGQLGKMVNQICIAGILQGLAEGIHFGQHAGLDMPALISAISQGAAQSWQMQNRAHSMLADQYDFGFAVEWMRKDLGYCLSEARKLHVNLPLTQLVDDFYCMVQAISGDRWDTSSLLRVLQQTDNNTGPD